MLNKIIQFSISRRATILAAAVLLLVGGFFKARQADVDVFPDLNAPTVVVMTEANGMAPEEVEQLITYPVEAAMNGATNVRRVRSSSTTGFSIVWVEFDWGSDILDARQLVAEKLSVVNEQLPKNVGRPIIAPQSSIMGEIMIVSLSSDSSSMLDLRTLADRVVRPRLLSVAGVAQVSVIGGDIKEYQIAPDLMRMKHYGISLDELLKASRGINQNSNGGTLYQYGQEYLIRGILASDDPETIGEGLVKNTPEGPILISDIAEVGIGSKEPKLGLASERGQEAVLLTVSKQPNVNTLKLTKELDTTIESLEQGLPAGVHVSNDIFKQSRFIDSAVDNVGRSLLEGSIFVVIILFLFLGKIRSTIISLVTLPISLLVTILVMQYMGLGINTMSLGGMAIAIGSLVDDAIVDVENVLRHLRQNRLLPKEQRLSIKQVVFEASSEVRMPILNSTLIIVVSFVPLFFLSGMEGRMLFPLGIAFIVALFASTLIALTLTPVLCTLLLGSKKEEAYREPKIARKLNEAYAKVLDWALARGKAIVIAIVSLFVVSLFVFFTFGHNFLPSFNEGSLTINISSMPGISLEESDKIGRRAELLLLEVPEIQTVARKTGRSELDEHALGINTSEIEAPFVLRGRKRAAFVAEVRHKLDQLTGVNIEIGQPISHRIDAMLSGSRTNIAIKLFGPDLKRLFALGKRIEGEIASVKGISDLNVEQQIERPQLKIVPKRHLLASHGISLAEFAEFIAVVLAGESVSQIYDGNMIFDLTVRLPIEDRNEAEKIGELLIDTSSGQKVPLASVADILSSAGPNTINREQLQRKVVVSANVAGRDLRSVVNDIQDKVAGMQALPEGYHIEYGGQFESEQRASSILLLSSLLSIAIIFLLLFYQFHDWTEVSIILINLPLALIGGVFALLVTSQQVSIPAIIGFISLFGIATRNGMLLIGRYKLLEKRRPELSIEERIRKGSSDRLIAILMTALTSALALAPLAFGGEKPGNEIQRPMAQVILGGLLTSTLLNAFIIPIVYTAFSKWKAKRNNGNNRSNRNDNE